MRVKKICNKKLTKENLCPTLGVGFSFLKE
jgi:hypothetical protein